MTDSIYEKKEIFGERKIEFSKARISFADYANSVLLRKHENGLASSTYIRYKQLMERITPVIGQIPLDELQTEHLDELKKILSRRGEKSETAKATALPALHEFAESCDLSIGEIARRANVPRTTVSAMFNGRAVVSKSAVAVAHALGKKETELFSVDYGRNKLAEKTILEHYRFVYMILEHAVSERYVPKNVAKNCALESATKKENKTLTAEELDRFYLALETEPLKWRLVVRMLVETGCVRGEIVALSWGQIDFENSKVYITHRMARNGGSGYHDEPVKAGKERTVLISETLVQMLKEYRTEQEKVQRMDEKSYVFTQRDGSVMYPDSVTSRIAKISKACGVEGVNAEKLRMVTKNG